jgi:acetolactate synthase-1/2/3 large subunit
VNPLAIRGADLLVEGLVAAGVDTVFSLSGNQIMPVYDALFGSTIRLIHVRHEAAAVYMAEAYAQATGRVGVALLTAGPGFANGLSAMYSAKASETPVLVVSGDAPASETGFGAFQEMRQAEASTPMTKAARSVGRVEDVVDDLRGAIDTALDGRPGPVHLAIPFDVVNAALNRGALPPQHPVRPAAAASSDLGIVREYLAAAARPLILAGPIFRREASAAILAELRSAIGVPIVALESPRGLADPSLGKFADVLPLADVVLSLGMAFDYRVGFGRAPTVDPGARLMLIDADRTLLAATKQRFGARMPVGIVAEPRAFARQLAIEPLPDNAGRAAWRHEVETAIAFRPREWRQLPEASGRLHPVLVTRAVRRAIASLGSPILVVDGGEFGQWCQACLDAPMRIVNGPSGAIGGGIPYAVGAKAAFPDRPVVALMGDGSVGFHFLEFETAVRENLPFVLIVGNDSRWNAEHQIQLRDYGANRTFACGLGPTRYDRLAVALGGVGEHVDDSGVLDAAIGRALASAKPACIDVAIDGVAAPKYRRS